MSVSVTEFIEEYSPRLKHLKGFQRLLTDLQLNKKTSNPKRVAIDNDVLGKQILSHNYDGWTEQPVAKAFKEFAIKNTIFVCGDYNNAH